MKHIKDIGLANKVSIPFASKICVTFRETLEHVGKRKAVYVGAIVREELLKGNSAKGMNNPLWQLFIIYMNRRMQLLRR